MEYKTIPCTEDDEELIDGKLTEINHAVVPPREGTEEEELVFKIENGEGTVIAGCNVGIDNWQFAILDILWVDEKYRGQGLGSALIREAEKAAGMISFREGKIYSVDNNSGHYRPNIQSMGKVESALQKIYQQNPNLFHKNSKWRK